MNIYLRLSEIRESEGLSKGAFADSVSIDRSQYSKIENGKLTPTINQLMEISSIYKVSLDWLITGKGEMLKKSQPRAYSHIVGDGNLVGSNLSGLSGTFSPTIQKGQISTPRLKPQNSMQNIESETLRKENERLGSEIKHLDNLIKEKERIIEEKERFIQLLLASKKD